MKTLKIFVIILLAFSTLNCGLFQKPEAPLKPHVKYLPKEFRDLYLGMPYEAFIEVRDISEMEKSDLFSFRLELIEKPEQEYIKEVTYYFDRDMDMPLYELIIEYSPDFDLNGYIADKYGAPNYEDEEWRFDSGEDFTTMVWSFDKKLVIAGAIEGTEWNE